MYAVKTTLEALPVPLRAHVERVWQAYLDAARAAGVKPICNAELLTVLYRVWAYSDFVADTCVTHPALFAELLHSGDLQRDYTPAYYTRALHAVLGAVRDEQALGDVLRQLRRREMLRIAWRDLAGWAALPETLRDTSALADACIEAALGMLHGWQSRQLGVPCAADGTPQALIVLGMGKLGAYELNFSSDVDVIFAYPEDGTLRGPRKRVSAMTNEEYFTRLAQSLLRALHTVTEQGFVFRVDTRLRPFGDSGPLVLSSTALEEYYQNHGREWERYALIKARVVAGDHSAGQRLLASLRPFVYRRYLDFNVFEALRAMKALIAQQIRRKGMEDNIKLGLGGIREIEFIGQALQLVRGGRDTRLQEPGILRALELLGELLGATHYLPVEVARQLSEAYIFLRRVENRLQEMADQQTHSLPGDEMDRLRLALAMGYADWDTFNAALTACRAQVHSHFEQVFAVPQAASQATLSTAASMAATDLAEVWHGVLEEAQAAVLLDAHGFHDGPEALRLLKHLRAGHTYRALSERGRVRLDALMPLLIDAAGQSSHPDAALARLIGVLEAIAQRTTYLALLIENPTALTQLVRLCAASPWISTLLARHPLLLDELLDARTLYSPLDTSSLEHELRQILLRLPEDDLEQHMEALRHFKQVQVLRVAAADISGVLPLMRVSDHLTALAEVVLQQVLHLAWRHLVARHGLPRACVNGEPYTPGFAVVGYGKLGGIELGYGSDLDLVFLHATQGEESHATAGPKKIDSAVFFARLGQRIIHILNAPTPSGVLYEVDMRLRPSGASGLLVSSLDSFADYQRTQAWTWEHQALARARVVAEVNPGGSDLVARFAELRREIVGRRRDPAALREEVRAMRARMRSAHRPAQTGMFDLKQDPGGIADIEFMVQYEVLLGAHTHPELLDFPDNIRQLQGLADTGLLSAADARTLADAYRAYRTAVHRLALQDEPACVDEGEFRDYRESVIQIWEKLLA